MAQLKSQEEVVSPNKKPVRRGLVRTLGTGGLFSIGYADVGAGIFLALSLVALHADYATPIAIGLAAVAYILTGLTYAELSSTYPMAGGSATYARAAFGDGVSFVAGWMLCLDYLVTSAFFSIPAVGYLSYLYPPLREPIWLGLGAVMVLGGLVLLNTFGIKSSVRFTLALSLLDIVSEITLIILGLVLVLIPSGALLSWPSKVILGVRPSWDQFVQAITLAMVSYLGIEAVAQAAEETKIAGRTIPRATMLTVVTVTLMYILVSFVSVNLVSPFDLSHTWKNDPLSGVAHSLPVAGPVIAVWISLLGASISIIGANAGIIGSSRMLYALSEYKLLPGKFGETHPKFHTPHISILIFGLGSILLVAFSTILNLAGSIDPLILLGSLYNVGALIAYVQAHLSVIITRNTDRDRFRPFQVPWSIHLKRRGESWELPILPLAGMIITGAIWIAVIATHELGRLLGLVWILL
ncbi:MAG TPA: APC family permease, partial [Candidatus Binatus sp.]|nr:APC family permease [Candidatus Binatus sp.]